MHGGRLRVPAMFVLLALAGCASGSAAGSHEVRVGEKSRAPGTVMTQAELQQELERFTGEFMSRMSETSEALYEQSGPKERENILRLVLLYDSSVLDIATDARPEVGLLDMVVFVGLVRGVFERHWL